MNSLHLLIDRDACAACDLCRENAPNTFEIDAEAKARVINPEGDPRDVVLMAADSCPMGAITVHDAVTGERLVPKG